MLTLPSTSLLVDTSVSEMVQDRDLITVNTQPVIVLVCGLSDHFSCSTL